MEKRKTTGYYELGRDETAHAAAWRVENNVFMPHFHSALELMYVEEGELVIMQDGVSSLIPQGYMIVNSCYMVHSCSTPEYSKIIVATIPLSTIPSLKGLLTHHSFKQGVVDVKNMKECRRIMGMMSEAGNSTNERFVNCLAEALLAYLIDKVGLVENASDTGGDLVKRILNFMQKNAAEPLNMQGVAAHFGYSAGRFSHVFNERIGCSFTRYLNFLRCRMAQNLIDSTDAPLIEIANRSGFSSLRTFHRVYREFTGHTPRGEVEL